MIAAPAYDAVVIGGGQAGGMTVEATGPGPRTMLRRTWTWAMCPPAALPSPDVRQNGQPGRDSPTNAVRAGSGSRIARGTRRSGIRERTRPTIVAVAASAAGATSFEWYVYTDRRLGGHP